MEKAIMHKGFSYLEILQPCISFFDTRDFIKEKVYMIPENFPSNDLKTANELLSRQDNKIPLGIFYNVEMPTFEEQL
jgi:2-oxoglutarate ferredoxin oxidoreductase subunit beta